MMQVRLALVIMLVMNLQACQSDSNITSSFISRISASQFDSIAWSPDGTTIFAVGAPIPPSEEGYPYLITIQDGLVEQLSDAPDSYQFPTWSPDGTQVAITVDGDTIWLFSITSRQLIFLVPGEIASWSSDGTKLAVYVGPQSNPGTSRRELLIVDLQGEILQRIDVGAVIPPLLVTPSPTVPTSLGTFTPPPILLPPTEYLLGMTWTIASGNRIAFSVEGSASTNVPPAAYIVNLEGGEVGEFLRGETIGFLAWSPDGSKLAYIRPNNLNGELIIAQADGTCLFKPTDALRFAPTTLAACCARRHCGRLFARTRRRK